jgi:hypothetical protein
MGGMGGIVTKEAFLAMHLVRTALCIVPRERERLVYSEVPSRVLYLPSLVGQTSSPQKGRGGEVIFGADICNYRTSVLLINFCWPLR